MANNDRWMNGYKREKRRQEEEDDDERRISQSSSSSSLAAAGGGDGISFNDISTPPSLIGLRSTRIYVGNIPRYMRSDKALINYFSKYGDISKINLSKVNGGNYAFIQYYNGSSADASVLDIKGRKECGLEVLKVDYAKTRAGVNDIQGDVNALPLPTLPNGASDECKVFIAGFNNNETIESLGDYLSQWGLVNIVEIVKDNNGYSRGYAFIKYACPEGARRLLSEMMIINNKDNDNKIKSYGQTELMLRGRKIDCKYGLSKDNKRRNIINNEDERLLYTERAIIRHITKVALSRHKDIVLELGGTQEDNINNSQQQQQEQQQQEQSVIQYTHPSYIDNGWYCNNNTIQPLIDNNNGIIIQQQGHDNEAPATAVEFVVGLHQHVRQAYGYGGSSLPPSSTQDSALDNNNKIKQGPGEEEGGGLGRRWHNHNHHHSAAAAAAADTGSGGGGYSSYYKPPIPQARKVVSLTPKNNNIDDDHKIMMIKGNNEYSNSSEDEEERNESSDSRNYDDYKYDNDVIIRRNKKIRISNNNHTTTSLSRKRSDTSIGGGGISWYSSDIINNNIIHHFNNDDNDVT